MRFLFIYLTLSISFLIFSHHAKACVSDTTIITTTVNYDPNLTSIEIRLGNLKLGTENPNVFCSCAISSWSSMFTNLDYVAFVMAGTNVPYANFQAWSSNSAASTSWDNDQPGFGGWEGFVAEVINGGLTDGTDVEMIIRASLPPGYTFSVLDSSVTVSSVGTDKWDNTTQTLYAAHQKVRNLSSDASSYVLNSKPDTYFAALDNDILSSTLFQNRPIQALSVFPNPVMDEINMSFELPNPQDITVKVVNMAGETILQKDLGKIQAGNQKIPLKIDGTWSDGYYLLMLETDNIITTKKILKITD